MVKILSQAGNSLADIYDVEGSIAGIDQLESRELPIVHEMGATVFSERVSGNIRRLTTGAILQSTTFDLTLTAVGDNVTRALGLLVLADVAGRINMAQVAIRDPDSGREVPIFIFDATFDDEKEIRIVEEGGGAATQIALIGHPLLLPNFLVGADQPQPLNEVVCRGITTGFGAGTVTLVMLMYNAFAQIGGVSSRGVSIPSW